MKPYLKALCIGLLVTAAFTVKPDIFEASYEKVEE